MTTNPERQLVWLRIILDVCIVLGLLIALGSIGTAASDGTSPVISITDGVWAPLIARMIVGFRIDWLRKN